MLIGTLSEKDVNLTLRMSVSPSDEHLPVIVLVRRKGEELHALGWDFARHDFCPSKDFAEKLGIEEEIEKLLQIGKIRCAERS